MMSDIGIFRQPSDRHFPTRDALIEAVYRTEVEKLAAAEGEFTAAMSPIEALRAWMLLFVEYIAAKQIIAPALNSVVGGPSKLFEGSRSQIQGAIDSLVKRAIKSGEIRACHRMLHSPGPTETPMIHVGSNGSPEDLDDCWAR